MAARKDTVLNPEETLTFTNKPKEEGYKGPTVDIFLPALEGGDSGGIKVDQYEHVSISNEKREDNYRVLRGEHVQVPVPVFVALKERYPKL